VVSYPVIDIRTAVEDIVNLSVVAAVLSENIPQEHQLRLQVVFIAQSNSPVQQCGNYGLFVGWVVVGPSVEVEIGMSGTTSQETAFFKMQNHILQRN
jgi:hypothetical protein